MTDFSMVHDARMKVEPTRCATRSAYLVFTAVHRMFSCPRPRAENIYCITSFPPLLVIVLRSFGVHKDDTDQICSPTGPLLRPDFALIYSLRSTKHTITP